MPLGWSAPEAISSSMEQKLGAPASAMRGNLIAIDGRCRGSLEPVPPQILRALYARLQAGESVTLAEVDAEIRFTDSAPAEPCLRRDQAPPRHAHNQAAQRRRKAAYLELMREQPLVFGVGPAGTGKTYLAAAFAAHMLHERRVERLILSRPALEAGERLGFLARRPEGKKSIPICARFMTPCSMCWATSAARLMEQGVIEVAPLAFMRGRTLSTRLCHPGRSAEHHAAPR